MTKMIDREDENGDGMSSSHCSTCDHTAGAHALDGLSCTIANCRCDGYDPYLDLVAMAYGTDRA